MKEIVIHGFTRGKYRGKFPNLNDYVKANRSGYRAGASMIESSENKIIDQLYAQLKKPLRFPIRINYLFIEPDMRRDKDNIAGFFHKVFQDSLVKAGFLPDDSWKFIDNWYDDFAVDTQDPRIEVRIMER